MTDNIVSKMIQLSLEKKTLLTELLRLSNLQKDLIQDESMEELNLVLEEKEDFMSKIDVLDKEFLSLYNSLKEDEGIDSLDKIHIQKYANIKSLKDIVSQINTILTSISIIDEENTRNMRLSLNKIKSELKQVKTAKKAYKGYNYEAAESMLIDEKK